MGSKTLKLKKIILFWTGGVSKHMFAIVVAVVYA